MDFDAGGINWFDRCNWFWNSVRQRPPFYHFLYRVEFPARASVPKRRKDWPDLHVEKAFKPVYIGNRLSLDSNLLDQEKRLIARADGNAR